MESFEEELKRKIEEIDDDPELSCLFFPNHHNHNAEKIIIFSRLHFL
jgi:hypothetical protein